MYAISQPQLQQIAQQQDGTVQSDPQLQQIAQQEAGTVQSDQQLLQRMQRQQALMQQAILQQQQSFYHAAPLAPLNQIEPIPSGNLQPGFDSSACRSVYVGNLSVHVTESILEEVFAGIDWPSGEMQAYRERIS